jgi:cytochrome oxidase Cu insertion factor (SCO1/SenC/PrrC family)
MIEIRGCATAVALTVWLAAAPAVAHEAARLPRLDFDPPRPGTYTLHRIMRAPDGEVVGLDGRAHRLSEFTRERITLLGFIYTTCTDPEGCPLAYRVFETVRQAVAVPALRDRIQLITLSFDPMRDSPSVMGRYARSRVSGGTRGPRWYFLTTRSARELQPLVDGFGQDVRVTVDRANGTSRRELSHVLKVFLIDPAGFVREIYTSTFLHPRTVLNDVETLLMERGSSTGTTPTQ